MRPGECRYCQPCHTCPHMLDCCCEALAEEGVSVLSQGSLALRFSRCILATEVRVQTYCATIDKVSSDGKQPISDRHHRGDHTTEAIPGQDFS